MHPLYLFDLDGTLINSLEDLADAANWTLRQYGFPAHPLDSYRHFVGNGIQKLIERALPSGERTPEKILECKAVFDARYQAHCMDKTRPYPGIPELLGALRRKGVKMAVLSNKSDEFVRKITEGLFRSGIFAAIRGQRDGVPKKPAPDAVWALLEELKTDRKDALFIGDSDVDILTAKNAGLCSAGVTWGFRDREELQKAGADYLISLPAELSEL